MTARINLLLLLCTLPSVVQAQYNYTTNNGSITIDRYYGPGGGVTIPDRIAGIPVASIGWNAFLGCSSLTSVTIPNSVTSIGDSAFSGCSSLTNVTIPNSVTSIGELAFNACSSLSAITVDAANPVYSSVDGVLLNKSQTTLIQCPGAKTRNYAIPNSVTHIVDKAFYDCASLTSVTIPNSVTAIGWSAFSGCSSLSSVTIPNSVTSIGFGAFWDCNSLAGVYFEGNAPVISSPGGGLVVRSAVTGRSITCRDPAVGVRPLAVVPPRCGGHWSRPATPASACGRISLDSPSRGPVTKRWSWKPARHCPIRLGLR